MEKTIRLLAAALNFRGKAKDAHQHEDEQV